jgi:hypothetical protein
MFTTHLHILCPKITRQLVGPLDDGAASIYEIDYESDEGQQ